MQLKKYKVAHPAVHNIVLASLFLLGETQDGNLVCRS